MRPGRTERPSCSSKTGDQSEGSELGGAEAWPKPDRPLSLGVREPSSWVGAPVALTLTTTEVHMSECVLAFYGGHPPRRLLCARTAGPRRRRRAG